MKLIPNHPELPALPEGQFWRVYMKRRLIDYVYVELRRRGRWWRRRIEERHYTFSVSEDDARMQAVQLANRIARHQERLVTNRLGDLAGDHPA